MMKTVPTLTRIHSKTCIVTKETRDVVPSVSNTVKGLLGDLLTPKNLFGGHQRGMVFPGTWTQDLKTKMC